MRLRRDEVERLLLERSAEVREREAEARAKKGRRDRALSRHRAAC